MTIQSNQKANNMVKKLHFLFLLVCFVFIHAEFTHSAIKSDKIGKKSPLSESFFQFECLVPLPTGLLDEMQLEFTTTVNNQEVRIPFAAGVDVSVNWGDGSDPDNYTSPTQASHVYPTPGTYSVLVAGSLSRLGGTNVLGWDALTKVLNWGDLGLTSLEAAFYNCDKLTDVPDNLPSTVNNLSSTFYGATSFNDDIGNWDISNVTDMTNMFSGVTLSESNYNSLLSGWADQSVNSDVTFSGGNSKYSGDAFSARQSLIFSYNWTITDGGPVCSAPAYGGVIAEDQTICHGAEAEQITSTATASFESPDAGSFMDGSDGYSSGADPRPQFEYKWQKSTVSGSTGFTDIPDSSETTLYPGTLTESAWFKRIARSSCMETWEGAAESNIIAITVGDDVDPNFSVQNIRVQLNAEGNAEINAEDLVTEASDNCELGDTILDISKFTCDNLGANNVKVTLSDKAGNSVFKTAVVTVEDNIRPILDVRDIQVSLDRTGKAEITEEDLILFYTENCELLEIILSKSEFSCEDIGENEVLVSLYDKSYNMGAKWAKVTVVDDLDPELGVQNISVELDATGNASITSDDVVTMAVDNCGVADISLSKSSFGCNDLGENEIQVTLTDNNGNQVSKTVIVTVEDSTLPVLKVQNIVRETDADGNVSISAADLVTSATDNCSVADTLLDIAEFSCDDLGENNVTITIRDQAGNVAEQVAIVTITDTRPPVITPIDDIVSDLEPGICETSINYPLIEVNDNCGVELEMIDGLGPDGVFPLGSTLERWVATDPAGNSDTVSFNVIVSTSNADPEIDPVPDFTFKEDREPFILELTGVSPGNDCGEQTVVLEVSVTNSELLPNIDLVKNSDSEYTVTVGIASDVSGISQIIITLTDSEGGVTVETSTLTITEVNDPPFLVTPLPDILIEGGTEVKIPMSPVPGLYFDDIDDDMLVLTSVLLEDGTLPSWAALEDDTLVCTPAVTDTGCWEFVTTAYDAAGGSVSDTVLVCVESDFTSVSEDVKGGLKIDVYPNPTDGRVTILLGKEVRDLRLTVWDIVGHTIIQRKYVSQSRIEFDLDKEPPGIYSIELEFEGKRMVRKLMLR